MRDAKMKVRLLASITIATLAMQTMALGGRGAVVQAGAAVDEYVVYNAAIDDMFNDSWLNEQFVIEDHTLDGVHISEDQSADQIQAYRRVFALMDKETVDDYAAKNKESAQLKASFNPKFKNTSLGAKKAEAVNRDSKDNHPVVHVRLSRVGFNRDRSQALLYLEFDCDLLCGEGDFLFLTKGKGKWKVDKRFTMWVS